MLLERRLRLLPKLVIFDLDGTLIEFPREYLFTETDRILEILQHPLPGRGELESCFADFDYFRFVQWEDRPGFIERFWNEFNWEGFPRPVVLGGVVEVLEQLRGLGVQMAIATARNSTLDQLREDLEATGMLPHIPHLATRNVEQHNWMDKTQQIAEVCAAAGVSPENALMIGDVPPDIISARQAGVGRVVGVLSGGIRREVLEAARPDIILPDLGWLPEWLESLTEETVP